MNMLLIIFLLILVLIILIVLNNIEIINDPRHYNHAADKMVNAYDDIQGTCADTTFGCCPDGVNSKINIFGSNCNGYTPNPK